MGYDRQIALALRLITKKGVKITIKRPSRGGRIGPGDTPSGAAPFTYTCVAILVPNLGKKGSSFGSSFAGAQGAVVKLSQRLIIAGSSLNGVEPAPGDIALLPDREYTLENPTPVAPDGGPPIVFTSAVTT